MAGIYIHIPFCKQACHYCNFHFSTSSGARATMTDFLVAEIQLRRRLLDVPGGRDRSILSFPDDPIGTLYFGGGTPSLLAAADIQRIVTAVIENYNVQKDAEITLEANPDDLTAEKLDSWKNAGVNRLSIGVQSFLERDLKWMNRAHTAGQAVRSIELARRAGFSNFSVDLIFGTPGSTEREWENNLETAIGLNPPHLSAYALTVEPGTALQKMIALKKKNDVNADLQAAQFVLMMDRMRMAGYEHYEISNFAKPGFRSRHNSSYWRGDHYIGIGPSAHSYNGIERSWNVADNQAYMAALKRGEIPFEKEVLTPAQTLNEYIMTSLRTIEGMDLEFIDRNFSTDERKRLERLLLEMVEKDRFKRQDDRIILTDKGKLFADGIAVALFV